LIDVEEQPPRGDPSPDVGVEALMNPARGPDDLDNASGNPVVSVTIDVRFARVALRELPRHHKDGERPGEHRDQLWR
jgi:hypothetical protein